MASAFLFDRNSSILACSRLRRSSMAEPPFDVGGTSAAGLVLLVSILASAVVGFSSTSHPRYVTTLTNVHACQVKLRRMMRTLTSTHLTASRLALPHRHQLQPDSIFRAEFPHWCFVAQDQTLPSCPFETFPSLAVWEQLPSCSIHAVDQ